MPKATSQPTPSRRVFIGAATIGLLAGTPVGALPAAPGRHPDEDLFALSKAFLAAREAFNSADNDLDAEHDPLWHAFEASEDALRAAVPDTLEGLVEKARVLRLDATGSDGTLVFAPVLAPSWAAPILADLTHLIDAEG